MDELLGGTVNVDGDYIGIAVYKTGRVYSPTFFIDDVSVVIY